MQRVRYEELRPHEFVERLKKQAVGYLPLGTLEWHEQHLPLGVDMLINDEVFARCARKFGGIVFPPLFLAPDCSKPGPDGITYYGMDLSDPTNPQQLTGSCYWMEKEHYARLLETVLTQAKRAGFKAMVAGGHAPADALWSNRISEWSDRFNLTLIDLYHDGIGAPIPADHAGQSETSQLMAARPELVSLDSLPSDRSVPLTGIFGADPRDASPALGEAYIGQLMALIERKLAAAGLLS